MEKLGEGGMGVVYRAEDTRLKRIVGLKFLQSLNFDTVDQHRMFIQEARAAAALDHPNICTIYQIDDFEDQIFISMAYVDGTNLKDKIKAGPFAIEEAVHIAAQIGAGLEAAHKKGIVHRDIKSANIMVDDDLHVNIMDFGLAQNIGSTDPEDESVTVGTAAYMSPEQTRGEATDQRTDIWSWGICLYEMLAGRVPFEGTYEAAIVYCVLNEQPIKLSELCPGVPPALEKIVEKAMTKDQEKRYASMTDALADLSSVQDAIRAGTIHLLSENESEELSIVVLPFIDMSPQQDQEYFCDGIADEIINALTKIEELRVVARTSAFSMKGKTGDVREIGNSLNVGTLLEGSVRKAGTKLRITTQLINVSDGYHLWSEQFDRELEDVFAIQEEIARSVTQALEIKLSEKEKRALEATTTKDFQAYDYYLHGRQFFYKSKRSAIHNAIEMFSLAIDKDPAYALAYAGKADCYSYLYMYFDGQQANLEMAAQASFQALKLDPNLAEAHAARGLALSLNQEYKEAEREFELAIKENPRQFEAHYFYARTCFAQGKIEDAARLYEAASKIDPLDYQAPSLLGFAYRDLNMPEKAKVAYEVSLANAEKHLEMDPNISRALYLGATSLFELGDKEKGLEWAEKALKIEPDNPYNLYGVACFYSRFGNIDKAIECLDRSITAGFSHKEWAEKDSDFDALRKDPRFHELLKRLK
jgi:serine/threonine protein kinase/regulator of sirC expression with transglutaminase-like and TPR domain